MVSTKASNLRKLLFMALGQQELGVRIKQAREDADLTQSELADRIGLKNGAQSVSRYERGETDVPMRRLRRIAEATGRPLDFFTREATEPTQPGEGELAEMLARIEQRQAAIEAMVVEGRAELVAQLAEIARLLEQADDPADLPG